MSYLVLHVRPYDFDSDDGRRISGASVTYLDLDSGATGPAAVPSSGELGYAPLTITTTVDIAQDIVQAPAIYDLTFTHRRGKAGRPTLALARAALVRQVDLASL